MARKHIRNNRYIGKPTKRRNRKKTDFKKYVKPVWIVGCMAGILTGIALVNIFGYDWLTQSRFFTIQSIEVTGMEKLTREMVLNQAGIQKGDNILNTNLKHVQQKLLAHPWVQAADVRRALPGTIQIGIWEHKPLAYIDLGKRFLMNQKGDLFKSIDKRDMKCIQNRLPIVKGLKADDFLSASFKTDQPYQALMTLLKIGNHPHAHLPLDQIEEIHVDLEMGLSLRIRSQRMNTDTSLTKESTAHPMQEETVTLKLGFGAYQKKIERFRQIGSYWEQHHGELGVDTVSIDTIDMNNLKRIVVKPLAI